MLRLIGVGKAAAGMRICHTCSAVVERSVLISGMNVVSRLGSPAHMLPLIALVVVCDEIKNTSVVE
jgi:hypothetical protein